MKKFFRYLICATLVMAPMMVCAANTKEANPNAMNHNGAMHHNKMSHHHEEKADGKFYAGGHVMGIVTNEANATIYSNPSWVDSSVSSTAKNASFTFDLERVWALGVGGVVGYNMDTYSFEVSASYAKFSPDFNLNANVNEDTTAFSMPSFDMFVNAVMHIENEGKFSPYAGIGIGMMIQYIDLSDNEGLYKGTMNIKNTFSSAASNDKLESLTYFIPAGTGFLGVNVPIANDNVYANINIGVKSAFMKNKFKNAESDDVYLQYRPFIFFASVGLKFTF